MIIDFHTHTFPDKIAAKAIDHLMHNSHTIPFTAGTLDALRRSMEDAGIDLSVVMPVATRADQVVGINNHAAETNEEFNGREIISFAAMHPDFADYREELTRISHLGFKGIKMHHVYQDSNLDDIKSLRIIDRATELGLYTLIHGGIDVGFPGVVRCSPAQLRKVYDELGPVKIIAAHMGGWTNWEDVPGLLADTPVILDTSYSTGRLHPIPGDSYHTEESVQMLDTEAFMGLLRAFGADRILFGTDHPWSEPHECLNFIRELPITEEEKELILCGNARRILGI